MFEKRRGNGGRSHPPCYFLTRVNSNPYEFSSNVRWPHPTALYVNVLKKAMQIIEVEYPEQSKKKTLKVNVLDKARQKMIITCQVLSWKSVNPCIGTFQKYENLTTWSFLIDLIFYAQDIVKIWHAYACMLYMGGTGHPNRPRNWHV